MKPENVTLRTPGAALKEAFLQMLDEHERAGEAHFDYEYIRGHFAAYLEGLEDQVLGTNLPEGYVPQSVYWLVQDNQTVLGTSSLRHRLSPALEHHGGHIGYSIRPSQRMKGYGTVILRLTLEKARDRGIGRVRVTCDADNRGSRRVIENNGGVLAGQVISQRSGKLICQYWIQVGE